MANEKLEGSRETQREQCPHINCAGHEWESWCMDCGERWPNNLHNKSTFVSTPAAPETPPDLCGKNMGNDLLIIPCDLPKGHEGPCERNIWPVQAWPSLKEKA